MLFSYFGKGVVVVGGGKYQEHGQFETKTTEVHEYCEITHAAAYCPAF